MSKAWGIKQAVCLLVQPSLAYFSTPIWDCAGVGVWREAVAGREKVWGRTFDTFTP